MAWHGMAWRGMRCRHGMDSAQRSTTRRESQGRHSPITSPDALAAAVHPVQTLFLAITLSAFESS